MEQLKLKEFKDNFRVSIACVVILSADNVHTHCVV